MSIAAEIVRASRLLESGYSKTRADDWSSALRQLTHGSYIQCRRAVATLRLLCRELEEELPRLEPQQGLGELSDDGLTRMHLILQDFRKELERFNAKGELGDLLPLGQTLLSYLSAQVELGEKGLLPIPFNPPSLPA